MKQTFFVFSILFIAINGLLAQPSKKKPNVILIMADDMGVECLSINGALSYKTPVLDQMANNGVLFSHCFSQPVCTPSRVKIMTGKYNYRNYVDFGYLKREEKTIGNLMKDAGYKTLVVGKWQLSGAKNKVEGYQDMKRPQQFGFDEYCLWHMTKKGPRYAKPYLEQNGQLLKTTVDDYGPDIVSDYLLNFMDRYQEEPFFIYYPMLLVHSPFVPTPDSPEWQDPAMRTKKNDRFFVDMVAYSDKIVGKIQAKLVALGIDKNTIIMFVGDNGTHTAITTATKTGPHKGGKGRMFDNGTHVPMVAYYPDGQQKGIVEKGLIEFSDFFPTLAEATGIGPSKNTDGKSFFKALTPQRYRPRKSIFVHYNQDPGKVSPKDGRFVRTLQYKLYHDGRFYDMQKDKWEQHPIPITNLSKQGEKNYRKLKKEIDRQSPYDFSIPHPVTIQ